MAIPTGRDRTAMTEPAPSQDRARGRLLSRPVLAWAAWDWASSSFTAVVTTFVFTVYLTGSRFGDQDTTSTTLGLGLAAAGLVVALLAPVAGHRADRAGRRTLWLGVNSAAVIAVTLALFLVRPQPSYLWLGVALVAVGNVFFEFAMVNYNALLERVATAQTIGRVSGFGWGVGYLGGIVLLLVVYLGFIQPEVGWFGVSDEDGLDVRVAMLVSAAWFALFAVPLLITVRDLPRLPGQDRAPREGLVASYRALGRTVRGLARTNPHTLYFLAASAIYRDGLASLFTFGGVIAAGSFGFSVGQVVLFGIVANVVAGVATIAFGRLDDAIGPKRVIVGSLSALVLAGVAVFLAHDRGPTVFWVIGLALTVFVGPAQSASRSFLARLIPPGREGELFGLYATTGRAVSFLGPLSFSLAIALGQAILPPGTPAQHWGVIGIVMVVLAGLALLLPVRPAPPLPTTWTPSGGAATQLGTGA
jgi:UMF1 family MFS transporter